ncbi:MAG: molybdopterin synthase sulfur carrier subunit [Bacteroidia bacterium]|jgi:molybdopterin converting factor small subunit
MKVEVKYFGAIAEWAGCQQVQLDFDGINVSDLINMLEKQISGLNSTSYQVAINHVIANDDQVISLGDEIAFLPPFAGG